MYMYFMYHYVKNVDWQFQLIYYIQVSNMFWWHSQMLNNLIVNCIVNEY